MAKPVTVTRYEVQREVAPGVWASLGTPGSINFPDAPTFYRDRKDAEKEMALSRRCGPTRALRVVTHEDLVAIEPLDLEEFALPLVVRFMRLRGETDRKGRLQPLLDEKRRTVLGKWATLSSWEGRSLCFAPEVPLKALGRRFPFARARTVEAVLRLLTLHELAHYAMGHNGLLAQLDHKGTPEGLRKKFATMEDEADVLTALWWKKGLTPETVTAKVAKAARKAA